MGGLQIQYRILDLRDRTRLTWAFDSDPSKQASVRTPYPKYAELRADAPILRVRIGPVIAASMIWRFAKMRRESGQPGLLRTAIQIRRESRMAGASAGPRVPKRIYAVSRYEDVTAVLRNPEVFSSAAMGGVDVPREASRRPPRAR